MNTSINRYLLDTNIFIHYARASDIYQTIEGQFHLLSSSITPIICCVTVGEIYSFARLNNWGDNKIKKVSRLLDNVNVVPLDLPYVYQSYAEIDEFSRRPSPGQSAWVMGKNDLWIAAVARATNTTLLTTDSDFDLICPTLINRIRLCANTGTILETS